MIGNAKGGRLAGFWPWAALLLATVPAIWHVVDFEGDVDGEYPRVLRPTFSRRPPASYRLAEPGDTIDRVSLYVAAGAVVLAAVGWSRSRRQGAPANLWPAAMPLALAAFWHAATPGPAFDGWHGLGWRAIADATAPTPARMALLVAAAVLSGWAVSKGLGALRQRAELVSKGKADGSLALLIVAALLIAARQGELPGVEPVGYWPRWAYAWGLLAFDFAMIRALPARARSGFWPAIGSLTTRTAGWVGLVAVGISLAWLHRPIDRFKEVVPGRIFVSGMPAGRGLAIAQARHHFRTIINLFPEDSPQLRRSPLLDAEREFAREHGIRYVLAPVEASKGDAFQAETLALAQDPSAWPILVHCHACMDRTPTWLGVYRFLVEGRPMDEILREIEQHRGYRPKASVTLVFRHVLPSRAPARCASDPTFRKLLECAEGTPDPFAEQLHRESAAANPKAAPRVTIREGAGALATRRP